MGSICRQMQAQMLQPFNGGVQRKPAAGGVTCGHAEGSPGRQHQMLHCSIPRWPLGRVEALEEHKSGAAVGVNAAGTGLPDMALLLSLPQSGWPCHSRPELFRSTVPLHHCLSCPASALMRRHTCTNRQALPPTASKLGGLARCWGVMHAPQVAQWTSHPPLSLP